MTQQVHTTVGTTFEISLPAAPTAGFKWEVSIPLEGADVIEYIGTDWETPKPPTLGGTSLQLFRFRAIALGEVPLVFRYRRRWEDTDKEVKAMVVRVGGQPTSERPPGTSSG